MATLAHRKNHLLPWRDLDRAFTELTHWLLRDLATWLAEWSDIGTTTPRAWAPPADIFRKGDHLFVRFDLSGVPPDKLEVTVSDDGVLTVRGERPWDEGEVETFCCERRYGKFERRLQLPEGVDTANIDATYKDGVLELRIPYREATKPPQRHIAVKTG
jgi:HSP20 family protein